MKTAKTETACDEVPLEVLLFGDEDSAEFRESAEHVESCSRCQDRLAKLAADDGDWDDVRDVLQSTAEIGDSESRGNSTGRRIKLDFLSPPSHPEMLGRLGRYEIEQIIGAGGMGIVLKGFDTELNRPAAIKVLAPHLAHSGVARQRFAREARAAAAVVHEHVVAIHNVESELETPFLVMQYVAGRSLQDRVEQDGPLTATEILRIGIQAASGLAAAHEQGVVHRDIKPANILLENGVERVLITDFGLARTVDDASLTHTGIVAGTPHYMSPEQANGQTTDHRTDLFSLGSVLYFMAAGRPPFRAERAMGVLHRICHDSHRPVWEVNADVPDELSDIIDRLLEKKPSRRFAQASDVKDALTQLLARMQQHGPRRRSRFVRALRRHSRIVVGAAVCGVTVVLAMQVAKFVADAASVRPPNSTNANAGSVGHDLESLRTSLATFGDESAASSAELQSAAQRLEQLEGSVGESRFLPPTDAAFWKQVESFDARLNALERSEISNDK